MIDLAVLMLTYAPESKRHTYLEAISERDLAAWSIMALARRLRGVEKVHLHVADDGSGDELDAYLSRVAANNGFSFSFSDAQRGGYGRSFNLGSEAIAALEPRAVLVLESDWILGREFDATPFLAALDTRAFGCIRLGYIGYTSPLEGRFEDVADHLWLALDPNCPERHVFAGHPRIETVAWQRYVGPWPEGLSPGETEFAVSGQARAGIAWPIEFVNPQGDLFRTPAIHWERWPEGEAERRDLFGDCR